MVEILRSATFDRWLSKLKDGRAVARILVRIDRLALGNPGDARSVGGGDKSTQSNDINTAHRIAVEWRNDG